MSNPVIQVKGISKSYKINHEQKASFGNVTIRDAITNLVRRPIELITGHRLKQEKFWALKDIDITIEQGDVVGIIGKNGSGKSTLLKILSRITEPTQGMAVLNGRVASLLEVGTGFHPELTGRENIFFNGSILGMRKKEIDAKFEEIVAFSGVEKFLDTPVKFYSSGMYVRLAFAVAAHLEPDVLIVDEVLAVGDAEFQRKSLGKMRDVTRNNDRTVIFVSHNMDSIKSICNKCLWLNGGKVMDYGPTDKVIQEYTQSAGVMAAIPVKDRQDRSGSGTARFKDLSIHSTVEKNRQITCEVVIENYSENEYKDFKLSVDISDSVDSHVTNLTNSVIEKKLTLKPGLNKFKLRIESVNLVPGRYSTSLFMASDQYNSEIFDWIENVAIFNIADYDFYKTGVPPTIRSKEIFLDFDYEQE